MGCVSGLKQPVWYVQECPYAKMAAAALGGGRGIGRVWVMLVDPIAAREAAALGGLVHRG